MNIYNITSDNYEKTNADNTTGRSHDDNDNGTAV